MAVAVGSGESIKYLIPKEVTPEPKMPMYHSKHSSAIRDEVQRRKMCHQTMGYAQIKLNPPNDFLRKKTRIVVRPHVDKQRPKLESKPPVPSSKIKPADKKSAKNFKQENIVCVMRSVPKKPTPAFADSTNGTIQKLLPSGLLPQYIYKEGYGKIPQYIVERQKEAVEKDHRIREREVKNQQQLRYVTEDERMELLEGLKKNWEDLQKEFQLLPMVTDTIPKIKYKSQLEKDLKELEKDIELIERNPIIYVNSENKNPKRNLYEKKLASTRKNGN